MCARVARDHTERVARRRKKGRERDGDGEAGGSGVKKKEEKATENGCAKQRRSRGSSSISSISSIPGLQERTQTPFLHIPITYHRPGPPSRKLPNRRCISTRFCRALRRAGLGRSVADPRVTVICRGQCCDQPCCWTTRRQDDRHGTVDDGQIGDMNPASSLDEAQQAACWGDCEDGGMFIAFLHEMALTSPVPRLIKG